MENRFAIMNKPWVFMYDRELNGREDELLCGWTVKVLEASDHYCRILTHYGYEGYVETEALTPVPRASIEGSVNSDTIMVVTSSFVDILSQPKVQGSIQITLPRGAFLIKKASSEDGYLRVETVDKRYCGYIRTCSVQKRLDSDRYLLDPTFSFIDQQLPIEEEGVRDQICSTAMGYLGVPYCWGGKTPKGIDCSGLMFMSYMLSGILIFRNSQNNDLYPVKLIPRKELRKADLIYWVGHVGMYLGNNQYIHSTGNVADFKCVINSLSPEDKNYRSDLAESIIGYGSIY